VHFLEQAIILHENYFPVRVKNNSLVIDTFLYSELETQLIGKLGHALY